MKEFNTIPITHIAQTLADVMNIEPPKHSEGNIDELKNYILSNTKSGKIEKVLIYNPDAIGQWFVEKYADKFCKVEKYAPYKLKMLSVIPPKTPVCFASIYSGASPSVHGICRYVKPILEIDTLFDALVRAGKKPCIVSVANQSMDRIFRNRAMDYYSLDNDKSAVDMALKLIETSDYDFIAVYNQDYDSIMHITHPKSKRAIAAADKYNHYFSLLAEQVKKHWSNQDSLIAYMPDHGVHREWYLLGQHGKNITQDMNIIHFYGVMPKLLP